MRFTVLAMLFLAGCTFDQGHSEAKLNIVIAASLVPMFSELLPQLEKSLDAKINIQAGASSMLAKQVVNGLPCDVVILADTEWMDFLKKNKAIVESSAKPILKNQLVAVARKDALTGLSEANRIAIADPSHVPAGKYAQRILDKLGVWASLAPRLLPAPDVRTALLWVERGEADAGIVYQSDAISSSKVVILSLFKEDEEFPIRYPMARCRASIHKKAYELYEQLTSLDRVSIFRKYGFQRIALENEST